MPSIVRTGLAVALILLALTSCSATRVYEGAARPPHEVVRVKGMSGADPLTGHQGTAVCAIDGTALEGCPRHIEFLPGTHVLDMQATTYGSVSATDTIEGTFAPGERYVIGIAYPDKTPALIFMGVVTADD